MCLRITCVSAFPSAEARETGRCSQPCGSAVQVDCEWGAWEARMAPLLVSRFCVDGPVCMRVIVDIVCVILGLVVLRQR